MQIQTISDVYEFFRYLAEDRKVSFHPDDSFDSYINIETHEPTFTPEECAEYDDAMEKCFDVCARSGIDIYEIGIDCLMPEYKY